MHSSLQSKQSTDVTPGSAPAQDLSKLSAGSFSASSEVLQNYLSDSAQSLVSAIRSRIDTFQPRLKSIIGAFSSKVISDETWDKLELSKLVTKVIFVRETLDKDEESAQSTRVREERLLETISLVRSLHELPVDARLIQLRQDAIRELHENPRLAAQLEEALSPGAANALVSSMTGPGHKFVSYFPSSVSAWYADNRSELREFCRKIGELPVPHSPLLQQIVSDLKEFTRSETGRFHSEGMRLSPHGLISAEDPRKGFFDFRYRPIALHPIRSLPYYLPAAMFFGGVGILAYGADSMAAVGARLIAGALPMLIATVAYSAVGGGAAKRLICDEIKRSATRDVPRALSGMALIREFLALNRYADSTTHPTNFARILDGAEALFVAQSMGSPLRPEHPTYVYNDATIEGRDPILIMGPNSGGKTSWLKDLAPNWILGQLGARGFFREATISPAHKFVYSVPKQNDSDSVHGRFGEELIWLRPALDAGVGPKTVFIFDEIGSGTAEVAAAPIAADFLTRFRRLHLRVIVATHNLSLKKAVLDANLPVKPYHPEVVRVTAADGTMEADSTHRILPGFPPDDVPSELGARRVMSKLRLAPRDLDEIVEEHIARGIVPRDEEPPRS